MLEKDPSKRISAIDAMNHKWFEKIHSGQTLHKDVLHRLKEFRAPQRLQLEVLKFLVNNVAQDMDFKNMLDSFRALDTENTGILTARQIGEALKEDTTLSPADKDRLQSELDKFHSGKINYSDFLTTAIDKRKTLTLHNLQFAFHHFDTENSGYITKESLTEVFHREGRPMKEGEVSKIMSDVDPNHKGKINFEDFTKLMMSLVKTD